MGQRLMQYLKRAKLLEADLEAELAVQQDAPLTLVLALNADSMGTWFFPALSEVLIRERVLLDLTVEDQDHTYTLLETGMAIGCISTEAKPMRGCTAEPLGVMRYWLVATPAFRQQWFPRPDTQGGAHGARRRLHAQGHAAVVVPAGGAGLARRAYPCHYVPGATSHFNAIRYGLGYGMVPELLLKANTDGELVEMLTPKTPADVALYWHTWKVQSPRLEQLSRQIIAAARTMLK
jgi:LysR family transcriptional regulator (chromosome initiation inhibitor)